MTAELSPREVVLRFLASIGRPAEAAHYLHVFEHERPEQFAAIHVSEGVVTGALDALVASLRFLGQLHLYPVLVFGVVAPRGARRMAERVVAALGATPAQVAAPGDAAAIARAGGIAAVPLVDNGAATRSEPAEDARFDALAELVTALGATKLMFVGRRSGLQPTGGRVVSLVDVTVDLAELAPRLAPSPRKLLRQAARILDRVPHRLTVSVTSPLDLLRELFTVKGAGTLIRRGSRVSRHASWAALDAVRLVALIEEAFGRPLVPGFVARSFDAAFVADDYRGAAIVETTPLGAYLSKFAVTTVARGEGVGRDLWRPLVADYPRLFWRSRADNPTTPWYREQCDGCHRITVAGAPWVALWRGLAPADIPPAIERCVASPLDFT